MQSGTTLNRFSRLVTQAAAPNTIPSGVLLDELLERNEEMLTKLNLNIKNGNNSEVKQLLAQKGFDINTADKDV